MILKKWLKRRTLIQIIFGCSHKRLDSDSGQSFIIENLQSKNLNNLSGKFLFEESLRSATETWTISYRTYAWGKLQQDYFAKHFYVGQVELFTSAIQSTKAIAYDRTFIPVKTSFLMSCSSTFVYDCEV